MMKVIWKYPVEIADEVVLNLPEGAEILDIQPQWGHARTVYLWALVDPEKPTVPRTLRMVGTGHPVDLSPFQIYRHVSTFQTLGGAFVGHVFEVYDPRGPISADGLDRSATVG